MSHVSLGRVPRTLQHPGPFQGKRIQSMVAAHARHFYLSLAPNTSLLEGLVMPLTQLGIHFVSTTILGGNFSKLVYCVAPPDPTRQAVIRYTKPRVLKNASLIFGNATMGWDNAMQSVVHCHATFFDSRGQCRGGHLVTQECVLGSAPISVLVTTLEGFGLRISRDVESNVDIMKPMPLESSSILAL
jgi:predicted DNA-binding protein with PD1-like motif